MLVTEYWHDQAMQNGWRTVADVTANILKTLDGETDPRLLGIDPDSKEFEELERIHGYRTRGR